MDREEALDLLRSTLESIADGILVVDRQGKIRQYNRRFQEMWRIPEHVLASGRDEDALGHILSQLKDPDGFLQKVNDLYAHPDQENFDTLEFKDGRIFDRFSRPHRSGDEIIGRVWSFHDVTYRRLVEKQREQNLLHIQEVAELKRVERFRTRFINRAAHELNTPLTPIRVQLYLMKSRMESRSARDQAALDVVERNFNRFERLVNDLMDVTRLESSKLVMAKEAVDPAELLLETTRDLNEALKTKGLELKIERTDTPQVFADPQRITQVLHNLIANAARFTPAGGTVTLNIRDRTDDVVFSVTDTGVGLEPDQIARLFRPFTQVSEDPRWNEGSGLGLYICKGIIELHGGSIWCESDGKGKGTTFRFTLPHYETPPDEPEYYEEAPESEETTTEEPAEPGDHTLFHQWATSGSTARPPKGPASRV